jgi:DNA-binding transcriptional regulator YiaG
LPNIASVLKEEIARVARKELRSETEKLKKASVQYRSDIAALKRRVATLEQQVSRLEKKSAKSAELPAMPAAATRVRFTAKGLRAHRQRLGLSAAAMAALLGVSAQSIYNWEAGSSRPREQQVAAIAALRGMGKKEASARLQELSA